MAIKKIQNNYTTPEQSKRLLELGVPADSADCAMFPYDETFEQYELRVVPFNKVFSTYEIYNEDGTIYPGKTPCWSVGQLIEIFALCNAQEFIRDVGTPLMEDVLSAIYDAVNDTTEQWDFSKLED